MKNGYAKTHIHSCELSIIFTITLFLLLSGGNAFDGFREALGQERLGICEIAAGMIYFVELFHSQKFCYHIMLAKRFGEGGKPWKQLSVPDRVQYVEVCLRE